MRRLKGGIIASVSLAGAFLISALVSAAASKTDLSPQYRKWLEEDVVYIISPLEKDVFLKLTSDRERDLFIEAFWKHRDPTPASSENEFRTEHFRRISYANHFFGREAPKPGWKTDRGRMYIILGEPNDIQRFEGESQVYPTEIWFYQNKAELGLPAGFNLVFFRQGGVGEYKLYSPARDGPQALLTSYIGDPTDYRTAYNTLRDVAPELAQVSLSLVPGEGTTAFGRPSLSSDLLLQQVESIPQRLIEERYAEKFLQYKDTVEVEYSANYIDSDSLVKVVKESSGIHFVHFSIELKKLSVNQYENKYYTTLKMNGRVTTLDGKPVYQFERDISLDFDEEKIVAVSRQPLDIHYMFPLIPGNYRLSILIKNEASKEFTSLEQAVSIPAGEGAIEMTSPILGYETAQKETGQANLRPFRLGTTQVSCQPNRVFLRSETLNVAFQVHGLSADQREKAELRYEFLKNDEPFRSSSRTAAEYPQLPDLLEKFPLGEFAPAHYRLRVSLLVEGRDIVAAEEEFDVTPLETIGRPWFYSRLLPAPSDAIYDYLIGGQLFNVGQLDEAIPRLERAWQRRPESADFSQSLAQAYLARGEYKKVEPLLLPFLSGEKAAKYEVYFLLGTARQKGGEFDKAIAMFDQAIAHYGTNTIILNSVGECYYEKGDAKSALAVWEKSLAINPGQPQIQKAVDALKGKR